MKSGQNLECLGDFQCLEPDLGGGALETANIIWPEREAKLRAYFIGFTSNKPDKFGKPQEIENSGELWALRSQEPVIKFSKIWRVKEKLKECWHRGT